MVIVSISLLGVSGLCMQEGSLSESEAFFKRLGSRYGEEELSDETRVRLRIIDRMSLISSTCFL